jgi:Family of unknown function (DUF5372)
VTHPFHPLSGRDFEFVAHRQNWGEDRVHLHDENGQLFSLPAGWTDVAAPDPFVVVAAGRCPFTAGGLLAVADLIDRFRVSCRATWRTESPLTWDSPLAPVTSWPLSLSTNVAKSVATRGQLPN